MKLNVLVRLSAELTGIPLPTVRFMARLLQKAGMIQTGKPGRYGGSEMTAKDAAALAIALIAPGEGREITTVPALVKHMSTMKSPRTAWRWQPPNKETRIDVPSALEPFGLDHGHTLFDLIVNLLTCPNPKVSGLLKYGVKMSSPNYESASFLYSVIEKSADGSRRSVEQTSLLYRYPNYTNDVRQKIPDNEQIADDWEGEFFIVTRVLNKNYFRRIGDALRAQVDEIDPVRQTSNDIVGE